MPFETLSKYVGVTPPSKKKEDEPEKFDPREKYGRKQVFLTWEALARSPKREMNMKLSRSLTMIGVVIALLLVTMGEFFLLLVIVSIIFVSNALAKVPPEKVRYEISNYGVLYEDTLYYWKDLNNFYFDVSEGLDILCVNTNLGFPGRLFLTLQKGSKDKLREYMEERIDFLTGSQQTVFDRGYQRVLDKFNLE